MNVTKDELQSATEKLRNTIEDKHDKLMEKWDGLAESINGLNVNVGRFLTKLDHQEQANARLSSDIEDIEVKQQRMAEDIIELKTARKIYAGIGGKFTMPLIYGMFIASNAVAIFMYVNKT